MEYVLFALLAEFVMPALALALALAAGWFAARTLGIPEFRPFRRGAPETRWKRLGVRTASVIAAFTACFVVGALSATVSGTSHSSMFVEVHPGPARDAGLRDGDRIVSIDGKPHDDFDAMRADIQSSTGPRNVGFERNGELRTLFVDPMPERRIGVSSRMEIRPATADEAIERAVAICFSPFRYFGAKNVELAGPVGIVKSLDRPVVSRLGLFLYAGAAYAAFIWPALVLLHLLDATVLHFRRDSG